MYAVHTYTKYSHSDTFYYTQCTARVPPHTHTIYQARLAGRAGPACRGADLSKMVVCVAAQRAGQSELGREQAWEGGRYVEMETDKAAFLAGFRRCGMPRRFPAVPPRTAAVEATFAA